MSTMGKVVPVAALAAVALYWFYARAGGRPAVVLPAPAVDAPRAVAASAEPQTVVLAGGCFWGVEAVFKHVKGVTEATSGYAGGSADTAQYELVSDGNTGHAESVRVMFDPAQVSFETLVRKFYEIHDPTQLNRQGPDEGTQYRTAIFYHSPQQKEAAERVTAELNKARFKGRIVTQITPAQTFWRAEEYHQKYGQKHPGHHCTL